MKSIIFWWTIIFSIVLFAEMQIDFSIGFTDTALSGLIVFSILGFLVIFVIISFSCKRPVRALQGIFLIIAVIAGTFLGMFVLDYQFEKAKSNIVSISRSIERFRETHGELPDSLSMITGTSKYYIDVGFLKKRSLIYIINDDGQNFSLMFPFHSFLTAKYLPDSHQWIIDD